VKIRNLSGGSILTELIMLMMPWVSATVTYHMDAVPDVVTSQEQVNDLVSKLYKEKHNKAFAAGWTQRMRPEIDKYLNHGEFVAFPAYRTRFSGRRHAARSKGTTSRSSVVGNKGLRGIAELQTSEIALVNPQTMADEILASVYKIRMTKSELRDLDAFEARLSVGVQRAFNFSVLNFVGRLLHYILLQENLIVLATVLLGSGM
jgi:hypothetical protein